MNFDQHSAYIGGFLLTSATAAAFFWYGAFSYAFAKHRVC